MLCEKRTLQKRIFIYDHHYPFLDLPPAHAAYNSLKHNSTSALVGSIFHDPSARDRVANGTVVAGDKPPPATVAAARSSAAYAAGEKAGPNIIINASIIDEVPITNDRFDFLWNKLFMNLLALLLMIDGSDSSIDG